MSKMISSSNRHDEDNVLLGKYMLGRTGGWHLLRDLEILQKGGFCFFLNILIIYNKVFTVTFLHVYLVFWSFIHISLSPPPSHFQEKMFYLKSEWAQGIGDLQYSAWSVWGWALQGPQMRRDWVCFRKGMTPVCIIYGTDTRPNRKAQVSWG